MLRNMYQGNGGVGMPCTPRDDLPKLVDVERAIESIGIDTKEGPRRRIILRLLAAGVRPVEVAALVADDIQLPASAALRCVPDLEVAIAVPRRKGRGPSLCIRFEGGTARDVKRLREATSRMKTALFTAEAIREAREALGAVLGRPINADTLRLVAARAMYESLSPGMPEYDPRMAAYRRLTIAS